MLMKQFNLTLLTLLTALLCGTVSARGETVTDYTVDFNTKIDVSSHNFKVAPQWNHIVGSGNYDGYGPYYMSYTWYDTKDGKTGVLSIPQQYAGDYGGGNETTDLLVTPVVSGTISFVVKAQSSSAYLSLYALNEDGTINTTTYDGDTTPVDAPLKKFSASELGGGQQTGLQLLTPLTNHRL